MKKIRIIFAVMALLIATSGIAANYIAQKKAVIQDIYYKSVFAGAQCWDIFEFNGSLEEITENCPESTFVQCGYQTDGHAGPNYYYISKKDPSGSCTPVMTYNN